MEIKIKTIKWRLFIVGEPLMLASCGVYDSKGFGTCTGDIKTTWSPGGVRGLLS